MIEAEYFFRIVPSMKVSAGGFEISKRN